MHSSWGNAIIELGFARPYWKTSINDWQYFKWFKIRDLNLNVQILRSKLIVLKRKLRHLKWKTYFLRDCFLHPNYTITYFNWINQAVLLLLSAGVFLKYCRSAEKHLVGKILKLFTPTQIYIISLSNFKVAWFSFKLRIIEFN